MATAQVLTLFQTALGKGSTSGAWTAAGGWTGDTIKCMLIATAANSTAVITNRDTYAHYSDVSATEVAPGSGYTTGGVTLTGLSIGAVIATHKVPFIATIPAWTASSFSAGGAVIYNTNSPTTANC